MYTNEKEHPFGCSLILLWVKIFKVYSFAGHLKTICVDIFLFTDRVVNLSKQANKVKLSTQIEALRVLCPANNKQTQQTTGKQRLHRSCGLCTRLFARSADSRGRIDTRQS